MLLNLKAQAAVLAALIAGAPLAAAESARVAASGDGSGVPPSWRRGRPLSTDDEETEAPSYGEAPSRRSARPWYQPRFAVGVGLGIPEIVPFEGYAFFGRYVAFRAFYTPPLPLNIRVEMPSDVISTKKGIGIANPDFTIRLKATYGAHYGVETMVFPFAGSFFVMAGVSHRRMRLVGDARSPVLVCSLIEAAKDPPCADPDASIQTRTELDLKADVATEALLTRAGLGWFWHVGSAGYFVFNAGLTRPSRLRRDIDVEANLDAPSSADDEITGALAQVKAERETDLEDKAVKEMRPVDEKTLPLLGLAFGVRL